MEQRIRSCEAGDVAERRLALHTSVDKLQETSDAGLSSAQRKRVRGFPAFLLPAHEDFLWFRIRYHRRPAASAI